jgi:hypothetical protein
MAMAWKAELDSILAAGYFLVESRSSTAHDLKSTLLSRLDRYHNHLFGKAETLEQNTLEEVELETAKEAINVVERVQNVLEIHYANDADTSSPSAEISLGTRDLTEIRTLISIVFKWGIDPLLEHILSAWPNKPSSIAGANSQIIDLTAAPESYDLLSSIVIRLMRILFPGGMEAPISQTIVSDTLLNRHLTDILRPCLALGWLPTRLTSESIPTLDEVRPPVMRLLTTYVDHSFLEIDFNADVGREEDYHLLKR